MSAGPEIASSNGHPSARGRGTDLRVVTSVVAALGVGFCTNSSLPLILGAIVDELNLTPGQTGLIGTLELAAIAGVSLFLSSRVGRISRVALARAGAAVALLGDVIAIAAQSFEVLLVAFVTIGAGVGMLYAAGYAAIAAAREPDRLFALFLIIATPFCAVLLALEPYAIEAWSYHGAYAVLAGICLLAFPLLSWLPPPPVGKETEAKTSLRDAPRAALAIPVLLGVLLLGGEEVGLYVWTERLGTRMGLSLPTIGQALGLATLLSSGGAGLAAWLGTRFGRTRPFVFGITVIVLAGMGLARTENPTVFIVLLPIWATATFFTLPYAIGCLAALDPLGRWSSLAITCRTVGGAMGPGTMGLLAQSWGYSSLGWAVLASGLLGLLVTLPVAVRLDRGAISEAAQ